MKCPKCNTDKRLVVTRHALIINDGPEGPLHEIVCTKCDWHGETIELPNNLIKRSV